MEPCKTCVYWNSYEKLQRDDGTCCRFPQAQQTHGNYGCGEHTLKAEELLKEELPLVGNLREGKLHG